MDIIVPRHSLDVTGVNQHDGLSAERRFHMKCEYMMGWSVVESSTSENCRDHIDCWVNVSSKGKHIGCFSVDVKAAKRIARRDASGNMAPVQDKYHWVEWTGRSGYNGWVRGKAKWIAFSMCDGSFLMVNRANLEAYVGPLIEAKRDVSPKTQWECVDGILWKRQGNKDEMTLISSDQLRELKHTWTI